MKISDFHACAVVAVLALTAGCGKQEKLEATAFAKALAGVKSNMAAADAIEKEIVANARAWCGGITGSGAGKGVQLDQNAAVADSLAQSARDASAQISKVRQVIDESKLSDEYPRSVRSTLANRLTARQRLLQDIRALLDDSAAQFRAYRQNKSFAGDTYPEGISKLDGLLSGYKPPDDALGAALAALKSKYNLADSEI